MEKDQFRQDVLTGLSSSPKRLYSKYFYDAKGDALFQQIMHLDEYYLTRAEMEIFQKQKDKILSLIKPDESFRLVELGAGDGLKTKILLKYFLEQKVDFSYVPVDISSNALKLLENSLKGEVEGLKIDPLAGDYFKVLSALKFRDETRNVVFFLGSNIGNFMEETAVQFLKSIHANLRKGDIVLIGIDLKKNPNQILGAYNDSKGITHKFNLNLLERINRELGGNFNIEQFMHHPIYDPVSGECRSYVISKTSQKVFIKSLDRTFRFEEWEPIFMEISKKYSPGEIHNLASATGFRVIENVYDKQKLFTDSIWEVQ